MIVLSTKKRIAWWLVAGVLLTLVQYGCTAKSDTSTPPAPPPPEVSVLKITTGPVTIFDDFVGQTEAVDTVEIRSRVQGLLQRQAFKDGARVRKGDLLFVIDQQPFVAALAQAKANLAQMEASLTNSKQNLARMKRLVAQQAVSQQDYDAAVAKEGMDAANVLAAQAAVQEAQLNLGYTTIVAPQDGVMSKALVKPGSMITVAQTLMATQYSTDPMYVNFAVSEEKMLTLLRRFKAETGAGEQGTPPFRVKLVDGSDYPHPGRLNFVAAAVDAKTGTLQMRIALPNPEDSLKPGQFVRVIVPVSERPQAIRIPQQAVQELQGLKSVYVIGADGRAASRQITASRRVGNDWLVEQGLQAGEVVVVEGTQKVHPGAPVKPVFLAADGTTADQTGGAGASPANPAKAGG